MAAQGYGGAPIVVIGIGHDGAAGLSPEALTHIEQAQVLAGGARHLAFSRIGKGKRC